MKVVCVRLEDLSIAKEIQLDHDAMFQDDFSANATLVDVFNPEGRFGGGTYKRYTIPLSTGSVREDVVNDRESEFPTFNNEFTGIRQDHTYTACSIDNGANGFFNAFQKVNFDGNSELITLPQGFYGSEPLFAKKVNAKKTKEIAVLRAAEAIGSAPIVRIGFIIMRPMAWHKAAPIPRDTPIYIFPSTTSHL